MCGDKIHRIFNKQQEYSRNMIDFDGDVKRRLLIFCIAVFVDDQKL